MMTGMSRYFCHDHPDVLTLRSRSVAPPPSADGTIRIVEIVGLDRKGRHNRRVKYGIVT